MPFTNVDNDETINAASSRISQLLPDWCSYVVLLLVLLTQTELDNFPFPQSSNFHQHGTQHEFIYSDCLIEM